MLGVLATFVLIAVISATPAPGDRQPPDYTKILQLLEQGNVKITNLNEVLSKIQKIVDEGPDMLQVMSDFDLTLTKQRRSDDTEQHSTFNLFLQSEGIPSNVKAENADLCDTYVNILHSEIDKELKIPYMVDWYQKASALYSGFELSKDDIENVEDLQNTELRDGTSNLITLLEHHEVPMLVYSAGIGDVVEIILNNHGLIRPNVHIISNFLRFEDGHVYGYQGGKKRMVHPLNKNGKAALKTALKKPLYKEMKKRTNVLLMGDMVGDDDMANGIPNTEVVLKIAYILDEAKVSEYQRYFDIVLVNDQTMDLPKAIVNACVGYTEES